MMYKPSGFKIEELGPNRRVCYVSGRHTESKSNPLWGGKFGRVAGTTEKMRHNGYITVRWDNGYANCYYDDDLVPLDSSELKYNPNHAFRAAKFPRR